MPRFNPSTYNTIARRILERVIARSNLTDLEESSGLTQLALAAAREVSDVHYQMANLRSLFDLTLARGIDLDERAKEVLPDGQLRQGAAKATGTQNFTRSTNVGTTAIPIGTRVGVPNDNTATYRTTAAGSIAPGDFTTATPIAIEAENAGTDGNVNAATITKLLTSIPGVVSTSNPVATANGTDEESDDDFYKRIIAYINGQAGKSTVLGLESGALTASIDGVGRILYAKAVEDLVNLCRVTLYVDDGFGTAATSENNVGSPATILASAVGGEDVLVLPDIPIVPGTTTKVWVDTGAGPVLQTEGTDYHLVEPYGQITFDPTVYPTGLTAGDAVTAEWTWYTGLLALVQKIINGDASDRANYPGYVAAGDLCIVTTPTIVNIIFTADITAKSGYDPAVLTPLVQAEVMAYINGLGIGDDVIYSELIEQAMSVEGMHDISVTEPTANTVILGSELARIQTGDITIT